MKKVVLVAAAILCLPAQALFAQNRAAPEQACTQCERLILDRLNQIAQNTENLKADGAAMRVELAAVRQALAELLRRPASTPLLVENAILTDDMGGEEAVRANRYCGAIGYSRALVVRSSDGSPNRQTIGAGVTRGPIVCYNAAE